MSDRPPRTKNGQRQPTARPASQGELHPVRQRLVESAWVPKHGALIVERENRRGRTQARSRTAASCRRVRDSGPSCAAASSGSSAMPQIGQAPGPDLTHLRMHRAGVDRASGGAAAARTWLAAPAASAAPETASARVFGGLGREPSAAAGGAEIIRYDPDGSDGAASSAGRPSCRRPDRARCRRVLTRCSFARLASLRCRSSSKSSRGGRAVPLAPDRRTSNGDDREAAQPFAALQDAHICARRSLDAAAIESRT